MGLSYSNYLTKNEMEPGRLGPVAARPVELVSRNDSVEIHHQPLEEPAVPEILLSFATHSSALPVGLINIISLPLP